MRVQLAQQAKENDAKQGKQAKQEKQAPRGITVAGEVKNYVPVTDAMLRNPDPGDWLRVPTALRERSFAGFGGIPVLGRWR